MPSKWFPWDFFQNRPHTIDLKQSGVYAFDSFDPFIETALIDRIPNEIFPDGKKKVIHGKEITTDWIESNIFTLDLFGSSDSYIVLQADQISAAAIKLIKERSSEVTDRYFILFFCRSQESKKVLAHFQALSKSDDCSCCTIEAPRFWEMGKLLELFADIIGVRLSYQAINYMVEAVPHKSGDFYRSLQQLALFYGKGEQLTIDQVNSVIPRGRLDRFKLAYLFGGKKFVEFFQSLIQVDATKDEWDGLFRFLQTHMMKIADPAYVAKKNRPSKYDKEVVAHAKLWKETELDRAMRLLGNLVIESKIGMNNLRVELRRLYLQQF